MTDTITNAAVTDRNPTVEAWIESFGVTDWEFVDLPLEKIDLKASHGNQARVKPLDQLTANRYGMAASAGAKFPPIVVARDGKRLVAVDGNHRIAGLPLGGIHHHPAYVVSPSAAVRQLMTITANTLNGLPFTEDEQRRLVIDLHQQGAWERPQIAQMAGVSTAQAGLIIEADEARQRASDQRAAAKIPDGDMRTIGRLVSDDTLNLMVATQAGGKRVNGKQLHAIIAEANRQRSDAARMRVCEDGIARAGAAKGKVNTPGKGRTDSHKLSLSLASVLNTNPTAVAMTTDDRQAMLDKIDAVVDHLATLAEALR